MKRENEKIEIGHRGDTITRKKLNERMRWAMKQNPTMLFQELTGLPALHQLPIVELGRAYTEARALQALWAMFNELNPDDYATVVRLLGVMPQADADRFFADVLEMTCGQLFDAFAGNEQDQVVVAPQCGAAFRALQEAYIALTQDNAVLKAPFNTIKW